LATVGEIDPIEIMMESLFRCLSTLEIRRRLLNVRIGRVEFSEGNKPNVHNAKFAPYCQT
jgi:hypothetical protein